MNMYKWLRNYLFNLGIVQPNFPIITVIISTRLVNDTKPATWPSIPKFSLIKNWRREFVELRITLYIFDLSEVYISIIIIVIHTNILWNKSFIQSKKWMWGNIIEMWMDVKSIIEGRLTLGFRFNKQT